MTPDRQHWYTYILQRWVNTEESLTLGFTFWGGGGDKYLSVNDRSKIAIRAWFTTLKSFIKKAGQLSFHLINLTIHRKGLPMSVCTLSCGYYEMDSPHMIGKNIWVLFAVWTWIYVHVTKILPSIDVTTADGKSFFPQSVQLWWNFSIFAFLKLWILLKKNMSISHAFCCFLQHSQQNKKSKIKLLVLISTERTVQACKASIKRICKSVHKLGIGKYYDLAKTFRKMTH